MAVMIPSDVNSGDFHGSLGESKIFDALKTLPDEYIVFHSVAWQQRSNNGNIVWGEADFTILHIKRGVLVLEVKSGGIEITNGKWVQTNTLTGQRYSMKDPIIQANRSKYTFIDLLSQNHDVSNKYRVEVAVAFPSIGKNDLPEVLPPHFSKDIVITNNDLSNVKVAIERIFDYYGMHEKPFFTTSDCERCVDILSPEFSVVPNYKQRIDEENFIFNRMTVEQSYLMDYLEEQRSATVQGGAGTGKTILAIEKAARLSLNGKVLFLCFNRFLLEHLKKTYEAKYPNIHFYNLASLAQQKTGKADAWTNEGTFNYLNSFDEYGWEFKHIIIDEGQDFLTEQIELLEAIAGVNEGAIYVFYDKHQLVHNRTESALEWLNLFDCRLTLSVNCRNTKNIATTAYRPIGINEVKTKANVLGVKPSLHIVKAYESFITTVAETITKYVDGGISKNDIVILTLKTEQTSILRNTTKVGSHKLKSSDEEKGILFTTSRKYKGLESAVVIVIDIDDTTFSSPTSCNLLYVATSRAKHFLDLIACADEEIISRMSEALTGNMSKSPKAAIASTLKVKITDK